jgi:hypothetical protein
MKIVHNQEKQMPLSTIHGGKESAVVLRDGEKELLHLVAEAFSIVTGGNFKKRKNIA